MERPYCLIHQTIPGGGDWQPAYIRGNKEGLLKIKQAIEKLLAEGGRVSIPVYVEANWMPVEIVLENEQVSASTKPCTCGCQKKYENEEAKYADIPIMTQG